MKFKTNIRKRVMELINPSTGLMKCKVCGHIQNAVVAPGGRFKRGSWQCRRGCLLPLKSVKKIGQLTKQSSRYNSFGSTTEPDEIGIDRGSYDPSYDHHYSYSGGCGNPSDGE